jgi:broad specificity phosphatase PhoE
MPEHGKHLFVMRPGETYVSATPLSRSHSGGLTPAGRTQVAITARQLRSIAQLRLFVSSDQEQAKQSAAIVAHEYGAEHTIIIDRRLDEADCHPYDEPRSVCDVPCKARRFTSSFSPHNKGGECLEEFRDRLAQIVHEYRDNAQWNDTSACFFTHGNVSVYLYQIILETEDVPPFPFLAGYYEFYLPNTPVSP